MTEKQKSEIIRTRENGASYSQIADVTGVSRNTVKSFCGRNNIDMKIVNKPDTEFEREKAYQTTMSLVRQLKNNGTVTAEEYHKIDTIMLEKYRPILGTLLSGNSLT